MSIGLNIKRLRREKEITQEQLAKYLGITSRAVSQWECERTAPDISQLPALCHIFGVSSDELLGIDIEKNNEKIEECLHEAQRVMHQGDFESCLEVLRKANSKFPKSYRIMERLANALICVKSRNGLRDYNEVYELCNRILEECTDSMIRYRALNHLATAYEYAGKYDKMREVAKMMPPVDYSYENFMVYRWKGKEELSKRFEYMSYLISQMMEMLDCLAGHNDDNGGLLFNKEQRKRLWNLKVDLLELLFPDGDYQSNAQQGESACSFLVRTFLEENNLERAWYFLEKEADFAIHMDTYDFEGAHTSPVLEGYMDGGWIRENGCNHSGELLNWLLTDKIAAPLIQDERYHILVERLQKVSKGEVASLS